MVSTRAQVARREVPKHGPAEADATSAGGEVASQNYAPGENVSDEDCIVVCTCEGKCEPACSAFRQGEINDVTVTSEVSSVASRVQTRSVYNKKSKNRLNLEMQFEECDKEPGGPSQDAASKSQARNITLPSSPSVTIIFMWTALTSRAIL